VPSEIATLDPRFSTRSLDVKVTRLVHAGLVGLAPDTLEPMPLVAQKWTFRDARTLDVTLRPDVTFHSGKRLEPRDVCATLAAVKDAALGSPHRSIVAAIARCLVRSDRVLTLELGAPRATLLTDLEIPILRADEASSPPRPDGELDGLGPFTVTSVHPGEITLSPASTGVLPRPRHVVVVRTVKDENARVQRLLAGRSDVAPNAVSPTLLPAFTGKESEKDGLTVASRPGANVTYLMFDNDRAPFDRVEARRAVAKAIDRDAIVRTLLAGRAQVADSLLPPGHWAHADVHPELAPASTSAFRSSGVTLLTSTDRSRVTIARAIAQMLGDAGIVTTVVPLDLGVLLARLDAGDFEMAVLQIPELTEPNVLAWFFHPRGIPTDPMGRGRGKNRARYRSAAAGDLLERASEIVDRDERRALYADFSRLMAVDLPVIPLWHEDQVAVISARARGFRPSAEGRWLGLAGLD
jgi:peptide/nickel transport system substrate-binding protein